jgi:hypothetical protein
VGPSSGLLVPLNMRLDVSDPLEALRARMMHTRTRQTALLTNRIRLPKLHWIGSKSLPNDEAAARVNDMPNRAWICRKYS